MTSAKLVGSRAGRIAVIAAALLLLWWVAAHSLASFVRRGNPALAVQMAGPDSRSLEKLAELALVDAAKTGEFAEAVRLAKAAIRQDATSVGAFRVLATVAAVNEQWDRADALLAHVNRLSRRDFGARLILIERAVARDDVDGILRHYDIALRTSNKSFDILAPILASAIADQQLIRPTARLFRTNPPWLPKFMDFAISQTPAPANFARLMVLSRSAEAVGNRPAILAMLSRLVNEGRYEDARAFLAAMMPDAGTTSALIENEEFVADRGYPPFGWTYTNTGGIGAIPQSGAGLRYYARMGQAGGVASQLLTLDPGRYRLTSIGTNPSTDNFGRPIWALRCVGESGRQLLEAEFRQSSEDAPTTGVFTVPESGCDAQWLDLRLRSTQDISGLEGYVRSVKITAE